MSDIRRWLIPNVFSAASAVWIRWLGAFAFLTLLVGTVWSIAFAPADYQQGEGYRILFVHVPAAWLSLAGYAGMAIAGAVALIWRVKLAEVFVLAAAPVGAAFTALTLLTGMLWGKPMWGAWWVWDARLTSELILLFLWLGVMALGASMDDQRQGARAGAVLALAGVVNLPIIHFSVEWWSTLHQGVTVFRADGPAMPPGMLAPLFVMLAGFTAAGLVCWLMRVRLLIAEHESERREWCAQESAQECAGEVLA